MNRTPSPYQYFLKVAAEREQDPAIIGKDRSMVTFGELLSQMDFTARTLSQMGLKPGSGVAFMMPMSIRMYPVLITLLASGINVFIPDPWIGRSRINRIMKSLQPDALIIDTQLRWLRLIMPGLRRIPERWGVQKLESGESANVSTGEELLNSSVVTFTGGSSGEPKGVVRTADILEGQLRALQHHLGDEASSVVYTHYPMVALAALMYGKTIVIPHFNLMNVHKADGRKVNRELKDHNVTQLIGSPALLRRVSSEPAQTETLTRVLIGGAPVSGALADQAKQWMPDCRFEALYGSTEAEPMAHITFDELSAKLNHPENGLPAGKPVPEIDLRIIPPDILSRNVSDVDAIKLNNRETGEIVVSGPHVNRSYYGDENLLPQNKIEDHTGRIWHRTGDLGYLKEDQLYLKGSKHLRIRIGDDVYDPWPVELLLSQQLGVHDVAYIQDQQGSVVVCIGSGEVCPETKIRNLFKAYEYPVDRVVRMRKALPRDPRHRSKIDLHRLRRWL